ncbi:MAG: hypothetical protein V1495_07190 [Pseudomonadota bacterium]
MRRRSWSLGLSLLFVSIPIFALAEEQPKPEPDPFEFRFSNGATMKLFGRFEMLTYYDSTTTAISDWLAYVYPKGTIAGDEDSFSMSVRGSPIGFTFAKPGFLNGAELKGRLEVDFVGGFSTGASGAYSPLMRLKQAWFSINGEHHSVLFGQAFGVFGPLFPDVGSWIALGTSGNPWIRLPQIRYTADYAPIKFEVSLNRPMGANDVRANSLDDIISDGEQSNLPFTMARLGFSRKFSSVSLDTGIAGVYGREKIRRSDATAGISVDTTLPVWMTVYDLLVGSKFVDFKGELFIGSNLNTFYAGILQGVNVGKSSANAIHAYGGWAQVTVKPTTSFYFNLGAGIDNPRDSNLTGAARSFNLTGYANANYKMTPSLVVTLEPSYTRTGYLDGNTNGNVRGLVKTVLSF